MIFAFINHKKTNLNLEPPTIQHYERNVSNQISNSGEKIKFLGLGRHTETGVRKWFFRDILH